MAHGKSIEMKALDAMMFWRKVEDRETRPRDRSLRGKARILSRRLEKRSAKIEQIAAASYAARQGGE